MFGLFKGNKLEKMNKRYYALLKQAMEAQRSGDIRLYSELTEQAETLMKEIKGAETKEANGENG